jgi:hypothetical protein
MNKKITQVDISGNTFDSSLGIGNRPHNVKPHNNGFIKSCYIKPKEGDTLFFVEDMGNGPVIIATLEDYAILPKEEFSEYLNWKERKSKSKIRIINTGGKK